jgi:hypothetical protein
LAAVEVADNKLPNDRQTEFCPEARGLGHGLLFDARH